MNKQLLLLDINCKLENFFTIIWFDIYRYRYSTYMYIYSVSVITLRDRVEDDLHEFTPPSKLAYKSFHLKI